MALALNSEYLEITFRLVAALAAGGIIGLERSFRGRAAGFRTHALVCIASSLLMLVTVYEQQWFVAQSGSRVVVDPTRMAQGIMTGIGFLGSAWCSRSVRCPCSAGSRARCPPSCTPTSPCASRARP